MKKYLPSLFMSVAVVIAWVLLKRGQRAADAARADRAAQLDAVLSVNQPQLGRVELQ